MIAVAKLEARFGRTLDATEIIQAEAFIDDASGLVAEIVGDATITDTWAPDAAPAAVVPVLVNMVRRALDNPHGYTGETNERYSYAGAKTEGIFATRDEIRTIRKAAGKSGIGALNLDSYLPYSHSDPGVDWLEGAL